MGDIHHKRQEIQSKNMSLSLKKGKRKKHVVVAFNRVLKPQLLQVSKGYFTRATSNCATYKASALLLNQEYVKSRNLKKAQKTLKNWLHYGTTVTSIM